MTIAISEILILGISIRIIRKSEQSVLEMFDIEMPHGQRMRLNMNKSSVNACDDLRLIVQ